MAPGKLTLAGRTAQHLRAAISAGDYTAGGRLPTEFELAKQMGVSRSTVRAALQELAVHGLVRTEHGVGTFVVEQPVVRAGLEKLDSITESIRSMGREPGMDYAGRIIRPVMPEEAARMGVPGDTQVVEMRRTIYADREVMAFSYDLMPTSILPAGFDVETIEGSLFSTMVERLGVRPHHSTAQVHAVHSEHVGWGPEANGHDLFVLLNQLHYDVNDRLLLYSRTYFIEGRYEFTILRATP
ncbi:MAG TPA: GntR family transcriptional regulator [Actinomycetales bacterium]|nr:GntR family transcriptional regulator [Actinomycetales bacterium]